MNRSGRNQYSDLTSQERFWNRVNKDGPNGCWLWVGAVTSRQGYGRLVENGHQVSAHRRSFELVRGPIPVALQLDHLCRVPNCVNPEHLEPVTCRENILRGDGLAANHARKTHCIRGHVSDPDPSWPERWRRCKKCHALRQNRYRKARVTP